MIRSPSTSLLSGIAGIILAVFTVGLAVVSDLFVASAVRTLGKQWAVQARLVEDHKLITAGPYAYIRNPIYTGMLGMLIATGLATQHWIALVAAIVVFMIGLVIRVRVEEGLLRTAFGQEFEDHANRVPAVLPGFSDRTPTGQAESRRACLSRSSVPLSNKLGDSCVGFRQGPLVR